MNTLKLEYDLVFNFLSTANLGNTSEQIIKEKLELAKSTLIDINNKITKIKKESRIKNFFIMLFTLGKINKNKENKIKVAKLNENFIKLKKEVTSWNLIFKRKQKNDNIQKWVNSINNEQNLTNEQSNCCSNNRTFL